MTPGAGPVDEAGLPAARAAARARRRALGPEEQAAAAASVRDAVTASAWWESARVVAGYVASDGEVDPALLLDEARSRDKTVVLPVVSEHRMHLRVDTGLRTRDRHGMEAPPDDAPEVDPRDVDLVLVPVVLADASGTRAGRGWGWYDRTFAFRLHEPPPPWLVGLVHETQLADRLPRRDHDVGLDAIAVSGRSTLLVADASARPPAGQ